MRICKLSIKQWKSRFPITYARYLSPWGDGKLGVKGLASLFVIGLSACAGNQPLPQHTANCPEWERLANYVEQSRHDSYVAPDARRWIEAEAARDGCKIAATAASR
jgi:hypothetical protein